MVCEERGGEVPSVFALYSCIEGMSLSAADNPAASRKMHLGSATHHMRHGVGFLHSLADISRGEQETTKTATSAAIQLQKNIDAARSSEQHPGEDPSPPTANRPSWAEVAPRARCHWCC